MKAKIDFESFAQWLIEERGLSKRSAKDVRSRLKRAAKWVKIDPRSDPELLVFFLEKTEPFQKLSPSVRSQLRAALRRYGEFLKAKGDGGLEDPEGS